VLLRCTYRVLGLFTSLLLEVLFTRLVTLVATCHFAGVCGGVDAVGFFVSSLVHKEGCWWGRRARCVSVDWLLQIGFAVCTKLEDSKKSREMQQGDKDSKVDKRVLCGARRGGSKNAKDSLMSADERKNKGKVVAIFGERT
jgi:hypothetical protein